MTVPLIVISKLSTLLGDSKLFTVTDVFLMGCWLWTWKFVCTRWSCKFLFRLRARIGCFGQRFCGDCSSVIMFQCCFFQDWANEFICLIISNYMLFVVSFGCSLNSKSFCVSWVTFSQESKKKTF